MNKHTAHIELFSGCIRIFSSDKNYGEEYVFSCSLHWINNEEVELKGVVHFSPRYKTPICNILRTYGVKYLRWNRKCKGEDRLVRLNLCTNKICRDKQ